MTTVAPYRAPRTWGDGATSRKVHVIADIRYGKERSSLVCACGTSMSALTPEALGLQWVEHGGSLLRTDNIEDRADTLPTEDAAAIAVAALVAVGSRCTCPTTDITDCPNFVPGDEEEGAFDNEPE